MRKIIFVVILIFIGTYILRAQKNLKSNIGRKHYIGYYDGHIAVRQLKTWDIYAIIEPDKPSGNKKYKLIEKGEKDFVNDMRSSIDYIKDDFKISQKVIRINSNSSGKVEYKYKLIIKSDKYDLVLPIESLKSKFVVNDDKNLIITTGKPGHDCEGCEDAEHLAQNLAQIDLTEENPRLENIGIRGEHPQIVNNHLYFHQYFEEFDYDVKYNLYRVPLRNWDETELVFRQTYEDCYVFPNEKYLFAAVYNPERNNVDFILYNMESRSYEYLKDIDSIYEPPYPYEKWKYKSSAGASMYSYKHDAPVLTLGQFRYVKNVPEKYTKKRRFLRAYYKKKGKTIYQGYEAFEDLPKKVDLTGSLKELRKHNFPRPEKPFTGTFITDQLMYEADNQELSELSKEELRLLRNAFFARLGYSFDSEDLQEFFMQFDWYENSLDRKKLPNDKIIVPPEDKKRIQLIQSVEESK
ncbi:MAG: YARHG domain-containing protein [Bacteroidales bacterium]